LIGFKVSQQFFLKGLIDDMQNTGGAVAPFTPYTWLQPLLRLVIYEKQWL